MSLATIIDVQIVNAFVDQNQGGNPAGIVFNADLLTPAQKLAVAQQVGLSETAFVSRSQVADFKLDFFTPNRQIAHCGHATIAAFSYLAQTGQLNKVNSSKETVDGYRAITLRGEAAFMEQTAPQYQEVTVHHNQILQALGISQNDLITQAPILRVNTGNSFIIIPVKSPEILQNLQPDYDLIAEISEVYDLIGFYIFCRQTSNPNRDADTRMFGPRYSITEEAATGMAAGPLACYLHDVLGLPQEQFLIQQGRFMANPSPSLITVNLSVEAGKITSLMAGGKGILVDTHKVTIY